MKKIFNILFNRWTLAILGLAAISLLIWIVGPLFALADYRPLESSTSRIVLISLILIFYIGKQLWAFIKAKKLNTKLVEGLLQQAAPSQEETNDAGTEEIAVLQKRFEEAVSVLKKTNSAGNVKKSFLPSLFSRQYLYELPWYIFIGAPGSGKTTALLNSGLQFPLADRFGKDKINGIGGTRNCDWWFTDEGVLIDTAGRYTTQESDHEVDSAAWTGFLHLLKKYRPRRPINGVIVTVSVADLLQQTPSQREQQANEIRKRIQELYAELNIQFPIYVLVTKVDLLAGFMEFFNKYGREERTQVWGTTFPLSENDNDQSLTDYLNEFNLLENRLYDRLTSALQEEKDPQKRALLYLFPQQFSNLKMILIEYLNHIFSSSRYEQPPILRGVYFTSGTQTGNPIDRVMGNLAHALNLDHKLLTPLKPSGKSFFITRLLKDVIFAEAEIAGTNQRWERKQASLQWGVFSVAILLTLSMIAAWIFSYSNNKKYVKNVAAKIENVSAQVENLPTTENMNIVSLLPVLKSVQALTRISDSDDGSAVEMGFGLSQGDKLSAATRNTYQQVLQEAFLPQLILRIEYLLNYTSRNNPELLYEALKAYIMFYEQEHLDKIALKSFIIMDWETSFPYDLTVEQRKLLEYHLDNLFNTSTLTPPIRINKQLIENVRNIIAETPIAQRVYNRLKRQGVGENLPEFSILKAAGPSASLVFARRSGKPLNQGVPGLFSYDGYYENFTQIADKVSQQLVDEEQWVVNPQTEELSTFSSQRSDDNLFNEVRRLYLHDYAQTWETFINDIRLVHPKSLHESIQIARILSADDSPLPLLLNAIVKEVTLVNIDETKKSMLDKASKKVQSTSEKLKRLLRQENRKPSTAAIISRPENIVDDRFQDLREMVQASASGQPPKINAVLSQFNELYMLLTSTEAALRSGSTPPSSELTNTIKADAGHYPEPVRSLITTLSTSGMSLALNEKRTHLNQALFSNVTDFCSKAIANRYPFKKESKQDVTPDDFARIFSSGGLMDNFFQNYLSQYVDTSRHPWRFQNIGDASMGAASSGLQQFYRAKIIRDVFFPSDGLKAGMELTFKPIDMDASITQFILDIDGQLVKYSHGPQIPISVQWPGTRGSSQVRLHVSLADTGNTLSGQVFEGPWALFRMFDNVDITPLKQSDKFLVNFIIDSREIKFEVSANSVLNPFRLKELENFSCPAKL